MDICTKLEIFATHQKRLWTWKLESNNLFVDDRTPDIDRTNDDFSALLISTNTIFLFSVAKSNMMTKKMTIAT